MKKKMAMIMTGVTVASSVAPIFANNVAQEAQEKLYAVNSKDSDKVVSEVRKAIEVKFEAGQLKDQRVYDIKMGSDLNKLAEITNATQLEKAISELKDAQTLYVQIQDKGHRVEEGQRVDYTFEQYELATDIKTAVEESKVDGLTATIKSTDTVEVKMGDDVVEVKVGDDKLDFENPIKDNKGKIVGFEKLSVDIESGDVHIVAIKKTDAVLNKVNAEELYDGMRLTSKGQKLVDAIKNKEYTATFGNYVIVPGFANSKESAFDITLTNVEENKETNVVTIVGDLDLITELEFILNGKKSEDVTVLAGGSRFETAIEVSKATFNGTKEAQAVILIGQDAVVDGLAAAPLAAKEEAPILLAKKDGVTPEVEAEMLRALGSNIAGKTIYIIGGVDQISEEAEAKLAKLGATVKRLAGDSRYETSLKIAKELNSSSTTNFVVGGNGEVDAMSIAAQAASTQSPIIVTNKNTVSEDALEVLEGKEIEIVGGVSSVSEEVEAELAKIDNDKKVVRLHGIDRKATNAAVISKYYSKATEVFVAKDGYGTGVSHLIDALTAAPLAGSKNAPIVLATNSLSTTQAETAELTLTKVNKVTQIGQGIAKTVVEKLFEVLPLLKK